MESSNKIRQFKSKEVVYFSPTKKKKSTKSKALVFSIFWEKEPMNEFNVMEMKADKNPGRNQSSTKHGSDSWRWVEISTTEISFQMVLTTSVTVCGFPAVWKRSFDFCSNLERISKKMDVIFSQGQCPPRNSDLRNSAMRFKQEFHAKKKKRKRNGTLFASEKTYYSSRVNFFFFLWLSPVFGERCQYLK